MVLSQVACNRVLERVINAHGARWERLPSSGGRH